MMTFKETMESMSGATARIVREPVRKCAVALLASLFLTSVAICQTSQGTIDGSVHDASDARVRKAQIVITSLDTGIQYKTVTNESGQYSVQSLNAGTYRVEVIAPGFEKTTMNGVIVSAAQTVEANIELAVGNENTTVTITAESGLLSNTSDVSTTVDHAIVLNLPYPERSSLEAVLLVPGVNGDSLVQSGIQTENPGIATGAVMPGSSLQIGGGIAGTTTILIDGSDVLQAGVPRAGLNLSGRMVQENTAITSGLSAKYGRTSVGAIIQESTSGASQYHGGVTWRHNDPWFNAALSDGFGDKNDMHENFYGFYVGGPVFIPKIFPRRNKTFFYVGVEPARLRQAVQHRAIFMTPDMLAGHFYNAIDILNSSVLKASGYAAALAAPRVAATTGFTGQSSSMYVNQVLTPQPTGTCPGATTTVGFPCGPNTGPRTALTGPLSDCSTAYAASPNPGATTCVDDLAPQLAQNPFAKYVFSLMPTPANPGPYTKFDNPDGSYATDGTNATYTRGVNNSDNRYSFRIDQQFNNSNNVFVRYTVIPVSATRFAAVAPTNPLSQFPNDASNVHDIAFGFVHVLTNNLVNSFRYSLMRDNSQRTTPALNTDYAAKYGLTPANLGYGFPYLNFGGVNGFTNFIQPGVSNAGAQIDQNFIVGDDLNWTHGSHLFQFGVDIRWIQSSQYDSSGATGGKYAFTNGETAAASGSGGASIASFILGVPTSFSNTPVQVPGYYRWKYYAGYFQDDWRATSKLTLNLGLRYEVEMPRQEKFNNQAFVSPNIVGQTPNGTAASAGFCFSGACGLGRGLWPTNYKGIEPRVGLAYQATSRMTVRASYSMTRLPLSGYEYIPDPDLNVSGNSVSSSTGGTNGADVTSFISNPIATPVSALAALGSSRGPFFTSTGLAPVFVTQTNAVPYMQTYTLSLQYQPAQRTLVQATYQGNKGTHLVGNFVAANVPSLSTIQSAIQQHLYVGGTKANTYGITNPGSTTLIQETAAQSLNPYQNFFNQTLPELYPRNGDANYNALYLSVNQRATNNVAFLADYTWSKTMDDVPDLTSGTTFASTNISGTQNPANRIDDYSVSAVDQASRFKAGYNIILPFGLGQRFHTGHRLIDQIIGGFSTSGISTWADGLPNFVTFNTSGNFYAIAANGTGGFNGYPNCSTGTSTTNYCAVALFPSGFTLRPNLIPGVPIINPDWKKNPYNSLVGSITSYLNPAAFGCFIPQGSTAYTCPAPGTPSNPQLGTAPRFLEAARSPRQFTYDMRFVKTVVIKNDMSFNVNVTMNDALNHQAFNAIVGHGLVGSTTATPTGITSTLNGTFGNLLGSNFNRIIRVGAEFNF